MQHFPHERALGNSAEKKLTQCRAAICLDRLGTGPKRLTTLEYKQHWLVIHTPTYGGLKNIGIVQNVKNYTTTVSS